MAADQVVFNIACQPGIFRDWTGNSSSGWVDGQYVRFMEGRPLKVGGWQSLGSIGLSLNNTAYLNQFYSPTESILSSEFFLTVGTIRAIKTFPVDGRYLVVVAADLNNVVDATLDIDPESQLLPCGIWFALVDDLYNDTPVFYPLSMQQYPVFATTNTLVPPVLYRTFQPGIYNWTINVYGVTSGGSSNVFTVDNPVGGGGVASSLALVVHAAKTVTNKNSSYDNYVYYGLLSNILDFTNEDNYRVDPLMTISNVSTYTPNSKNPQYLFSPMLYPLTQWPRHGLNYPGVSNIYVYPTPVETNAIFATDEVIVSGGVEAVGPYLFAYGNNGLLRNCTPNNPQAWNNLANQYYSFQPGLANDNNVDNYKVLATKIVRSGAGLSALSWTSSGLWLIQTSDDPASVFSYTNISHAVSLLSYNCIVENAGIYYWIGEDKFYLYNGSIQPLPNPVSFVWFFDNLNFAARSTTFSFKSPHYNEIWWVFPFGTSVVPNHAIIFNYLENTWYDTVWDRTAGYYDYSYFKPILGGGTIDVPVNWNNAYTLTADLGGMTWLNFKPNLYSNQAIWQHEIGYDQVSPNGIQSIDSYVTSCDIGAMNGGPAASNEGLQGIYSWTSVEKILPDAIGSGNQYLQILTKDFPQSQYVQQDYLVYNLNLIDGQSTNGVRQYGYQPIGKQGRLVFVKFGCNEVGSNYFLGKPLIMIRPGDKQ